MQRRAAIHVRANSENRIIKRVTFIVTFICVAVLAVMAVCLRIRELRVAQLHSQIGQLDACIENMNDCIEQYHNLPAIQQRAEQLNMHTVREDEICYIHVAMPNRTVQTMSIADTTNQ